MPQAVDAKTGMPRRWLAAETILPLQKNNVPTRQSIRLGNAVSDSCNSGQYNSATPLIPTKAASRCRIGGSWRPSAAPIRTLTNEAVEKTTAKSPDATPLAA